MRLELWNTTRLATAIARKEISAEDRFLYLLVSNVIWVSAAYVGAVLVTPSAGWLYWYEFLLVLIVTVFGLVRCRDKYRIIGDDRLLEACVVLGVPLSIKFLLFTWLAYFGFGWGLHQLLAGLQLTSESPVAMISFLANGTMRLYPFLIATIGAAVYYIRLAYHLQTVSAVTGGT